MCSASGNSSSTSSPRPQLVGRVGEAVHEQPPRSTCKPSWRRRCTPLRTASSSRGEDYVALEVDPFGDRDACPAPGDRQGSGIVGSQISSLCTRRISISSRCPWVTNSRLPRRSSRSWCCPRIVVPCTRMSSVGRTASSEQRPVALGEQREPVHHPRRLVVERGRGLVEQDLALGCDADEVGERAADVDADAVARLGPVTRLGGTPVAARVAAASTASVRSSSEPVEHHAVVAARPRRARTRRARRRARPAGRGRAVAPTAAPAVVVHDVRPPPSAPSWRCAPPRSGRRCWRG